MNQSILLFLLGCAPTDTDGDRAVTIDSGVVRDSGVEQDTDEQDTDEQDSDGEVVSCLEAGDYDEVVVIDGFTHRFRLHVPPDLTADAPLVVQLHGGGSDGAAMEVVSTLSAQGDVQGYLTLTPEGWEVPLNGSQVWNAGACCGPTDQQPDHVHAVREMIGLAEEMGACIDRTRVFATGHSNGGMMTYRLACEASDLFSAVAVSAGALVSEDLSGAPVTVFTCAPERPVSILHVHGLEDGCVPFEGGTSEATGNTTLPIDAVMARWRAINRCAADADESGDDVVQRRAWSCADDASVALITVEGLGHAWAGSPIYGNPERCGGATTDAVSTTQEAWRFFQAHPRSAVAGQ
ncbi:MAG: prolyl oligopeptidase family serine peptidase [Myxococcota bacterium]